MSSSTTILCFRNSELLRQDLLPWISPQRDSWCNVFPWYFCNSNSNHFLAAWENSRAVLDIIQASLFYYFCDLYISKVEKTSNTETSFRFWISLQILGFPNYLPTSWGTRVGLPLLCKRLIQKIVNGHYPRVFPGAHPLNKKPEDSEYEIDHTPLLSETPKVKPLTTCDKKTKNTNVFGRLCKLIRSVPWLTCSNLQSLPCELFEVTSISDDLVEGTARKFQRVCGKTLDFKFRK